MRRKGLVIDIVKRRYLFLKVDFWCLTDIFDGNRVYSAYYTPFQKGGQITLVSSDLNNYKNINRRNMNLMSLFSIYGQLTAKPFFSRLGK